MRRILEPGYWIAGIIVAVLAVVAYIAPPSQPLPPRPPENTPGSSAPQPAKPPGPSAGPEPTVPTTNVPPPGDKPPSRNDVRVEGKKEGSYAVGEEFQQMFATARLFNVEIVDGQLLRFNCEIAWRFSPPAPEVFLDDPGNTTLLLDQRGRPHQMREVVGISATKPTVVPVGGRQRFALTFPLPRDLESFSYQTTLLIKRPDYELRLQMKGTKPIRIDDFR